MDRIPVLKISASSYSGSTLLAFLLNTHPDIFTVSETDGWDYKKPFYCSCGAPLPDCPFFQLIGETFRAHSLPFDFKRFGTGYRLVRNPRHDRYLLKGLPVYTSTRLERVRDAVVARIPAFRRRLELSDRANLTFIRTGLSYSGAHVFVDACKPPYRVRQLARIAELDIRPVHLVRDVRGIVASNVRKRERAAGDATRAWIRQQEDIVRIQREFPATMTVHYEDLCYRVDDVLAELHRFAGLDPRPAPADFRSVEHHILGNRMRVQGTGRIRADDRWRQELSAADVAEITRIGHAFTRRHPGHEVSRMICHYLGAS